MSNKISYADCINSLVPGASWTISGNDYSSLEWLNNNFTKPTENEIVTKKIELKNELPLQRLREQRNFLLMESDKYVLPDYPHSSDNKKQEWLTYRQGLRDITTQTPSLDEDGNVININWPTIPS
tara:strand:- start:2085 stop:2459 length:375 start_codon:yes stop_codon:yes gene_type:complete